MYRRGGYGWLVRSGAPQTQHRGDACCIAANAKGLSGLVAARMQGVPRSTSVRTVRPRLSNFGLGLEHLAATIHAGLQVDMVRTAQLARILVLDISRGLERIGRAPHA